MQTIKRVTAMLLVLTLMLSCFPMAARASALTTTDPTSTTAATAEPYRFHRAGGRNH